MQMPKPDTLAAAFVFHALRANPDAHPRESPVLFDNGTINIQIKSHSRFLSGARRHILARPPGILAAKTNTLAEERNRTCVSEGSRHQH